MRTQGLFVSIKRLNIHNPFLRNYVEKLQYLAMHDPLTNLPNRTLFLDRLQTSIKKAKRLGLKLALLYIDIDKFKMINDIYGHGAGDEALIHTAKILKSSIRESDTCARLGGDEFVILLEGVRGPDTVDGIAYAILEKTKYPFRAAKQVMKISVSIGIAQYPKDSEDQTLIDCADSALAKAKREGGGKYHWFSGSIELKEDPCKLRPH